MDAEHKDVESLRRRVRHVARERIGPEVPRAEDERAVTPEIRSALASAGCYGRLLPRAFGGQEHGIRAFLAQQEELARVWPTAAVAATWTNLCGTLIARHGSEEQRTEVLPAFARGSQTGAVAWTEPHGGSDAAAIATRASRVPTGWSLTGTKCFIDNAGRADVLVVGARTEDGESRRSGLSMFVVRRSDPGFLFGGTYETLGLNAAGVGWFELDDCRLPSGRLLGKRGRGFYQMMGMVEVGRAGVAAICLGIGEAALREAVSFLRERTSFGRRLAENDAVIAIVADLRTRLDAARLLTERVADMVERGRPCGPESAMAKLWSSEIAVEAATTALRLHGGLGYTSRTPIERLLRDSHAFTIGEGTSDIMRLIVGRAEFERSPPSATGAPIA